MNTKYQALIDLLFLKAYKAVKSMCLLKRPFCSPINVVFVNLFFTEEHKIEEQSMQLFRLWVPLSLFPRTSFRAKLEPKHTMATTLGAVTPWTLMTPLAPVEMYRPTT